MYSKINDLLVSLVSDAPQGSVIDPRPLFQPLHQDSSIQKWFDLELASGAPALPPVWKPITGCGEPFWGLKEGSSTTHRLATALLCTLLELAVA